MFEKRGMRKSARFYAKTLFLFCVVSEAVRHTRNCRTSAPSQDEVVMKKFLRTMAVCACLTANLYGCVDADTLPVEPRDENVSLATHVKDWRDEVIYQLIVDRFYNGDINNDFNVDTRSMSRYHGGDWQGIIDKLDYLQELGVTTLWISPVVKNVEEDAGFASYHGYWTVDFMKHNPHFGDLATLRRLSDELHKRNMKLIIDIVTNHVGQVFFYDINMNGQPNEWLAGSGEPDKGSGLGKDDIGALSRVTEYDPDFNPKGINAYTSMGISGKAPIVFFDMPSINRTAPGPQNLDFDHDGVIGTTAEQLGFANKDWYHQRGRTFDYDALTCTKFNANGVCSEYENGAVPCYESDASGNCTNWGGCTDYNTFKCACERRLTNYDGSDGGYLDGERRGYCQNMQTLLGDFPGGLKDVATERADVRQAMIDVFSYWIDVTDCDGFRIDTLKHVEYSFWETFAPAIREHAAQRGKKNFLMFGEAFDGNDILLASYVENKKSVDSVFLFSQKYAVDNVFKCAPGSKRNTNGECAYPGTRDLYGWDYTEKIGGRHALFSNEPRDNGVVDENGNGVAPRDLLVNFLDNHDVGRYLFDKHDENSIDSLKNALTFILTQRGIPCIYYGTEQGFMGGNDPANRENMSDITASIFSQNTQFYQGYKPWDTKNPLFTHIKEVIRLRNAVPALRRGTVEPMVKYSTSSSGDDAGVYAFYRTYENKSAMVAINIHEKQQGSASLKAPSTWSNGTKLVDLLDASYSVTVGSDVNITIPSNKTRILIPESDKSAYNL